MGEVFMKGNEAFFELRQYRIKNGKMKEWVDLMEDTIIPMQIGKGMVVIGSFTCPEEDDLYVWIRRFDSEEQRKALYEAVYESAEWKDEISPLVGDLLDRERIKVTRISPTSKSVIR